MAFKGLRFAGLEWKNITASKAMWVVIAAIAIMPLLYGALYLAAFQDPYARLNTVPVAVVNEDAGATIAAQSRNLGDDVVKELKGNNEGLQWNFVSAADAQKGLEDGAYYMTCTIPADFSKSIASAETSDPQRAQLKVSYNQSENMLASQIGETVWKEVRTKVNNTISNQYWTTVLNRVADSGKDIKKAADGAGELNKGMIAAKEGSQLITTNLGTLSDGTTALKSGLGDLTSGTVTLKEGTQTLVSGASQLKDGTAQVAGGASQVAGGAAQLHNQGTSVLAAGAHDLAQQTVSLPQQANQLAEGAASLNSGLNTAVSALGDATNNKTLIGGQTAMTVGISALEYGIPSEGVQGLSGAQTGAEKLAAGLAGATLAVDAALGQVASGDEQIDLALAELEKDTPDKAAVGRYLVAAQKQNAIASGTLAALKGSSAQGTGLAAAKTGADELATGLSLANTALTGLIIPGSEQVLTGLVQLKGDAAAQTGLSYAAAGSAQLAAGTRQLASQAPLLAGGIQRLNAGALQVNANMGTLVSGSSQVASGASQVDAGATAAVSGAQQLNDGALQLNAGARSAQEGATQIASGATQLKDGSSNLTTGLQGAVSGSGELSSKLTEGAQSAASQTTNIDGKADMMSEPIEIANDYYTTVKNYGTGFAPYFMALGLWVGGLVAGFVFKPLNKRLILSGGNPIMVAFSSYIPMAFFALIQATLLMVVLQFGLQLQIDNVPAFYGMGFLAALVFAAIMQFLMGAFGFPGKFLAIILLMLQLTACAGTFPIQTTPAFFQAISPFMPMTYVVQGMRQIMTGLDYSVVIFDCFVLLMIGLVCFFLTAFVAYRKRTVRMDDLHPILNLG